MENVNTIDIDNNSLTNKLDLSESELIDKLNQLHKLLESKLPEGLIIAFSGGVDSAFLLWASKKVLEKSGGRLLALTTDSPSLTRAEFQEAIDFAMDFILNILKLDIKKLCVGVFSGDNDIPPDTESINYWKKWGHMIRQLKFGGFAGPVGGLAPGRRPGTGLHPLMIEFVPG